MSNEKQESLADIVADMRQGMNPNGTAECQYLESDICTLADRIEAAWKREHDELVYSFDQTKELRSKAPDPSAYAIEGMKEWRRNKEPSPSQAREEGDSGNPECLTKDNGDIVPQSGSVCNAAAMREVLERVC